MTQVPELPLPAEEAEAKSGFNMRRVVLLAMGGLLGLLALLFVGALLLSTVSDVEGVAQVVRLVRDLVIILLVLEGALIILALAVLVLQLARLIALIQTEIKPILENTQETLKTAKGTVEFMSQNVAQPVIRVGGFFAALTLFVENIFGLRRAVRQGQLREDADETAE
jgi:hypothetical protein